MTEDNTIRATVGQRVQVVNRYNGHHFRMWEVVERVPNESGADRFKSLTGNVFWCLAPDEYVFAPPEEPDEEWT